jgi:hypothetical protein
MLAKAMTRVGGKITYPGDIVSNSDRLITVVVAIAIARPSGVKCKEQLRWYSKAELTY